MMNRFSALRATSLRTGASSCAALVVLFLVGCAPFATFPPDGAGPNVYPWMAPCPEVMASSLKEAHNRVAPGSPLIYNLPANISRMAWEDVQDRLGPTARRMQEGDEVVWDLERFGIRNTKAFSDIAYWNNGKGVLVTISLERNNIMPFRFSHLKRYYISMSSMPKSNFPPPRTTPESGDAGSEDQK
jgi:hypothetical protein